MSAVRREGIGSVQTRGRGCSSGADICTFWCKKLTGVFAQTKEGFEPVRTRR